MQAVAGAAAMVLLADAAPPPLARYTVTPVVAGGVLQGLDVDLRFDGDGDGVTNLLLPDAWSGETRLYDAIGNLQVEGAAVEAPSPARRILRHRPGGPIRVSYRVGPDVASRPRADDSLWPQLEPDSFVVLGETALIVPNGLQDRPAAFAWGPVPDGWAVASDLDHLPGGRAPSLREVLDSALVGGAGLRVLERPVGGARLRVVVVGAFGFDADAFAGAVARVVETSNRFWGDVGEPYFVVLAATPATTPSGARSQRGVGLGDAFAVYATPDVGADDLRRLLTHEHLHAWMPRRLGGVRVGVDQRLDAWFSEGVTEFLAYRLLLRSGAWTPARFAAAYDPMLAARDGAEGDPDLRRSPYRQGLLLATVWDARLRDLTAGLYDLDDVLRRARAEAAAAGETGRGPTAPERFVAAYATLGGGDLGPDLRRHVERGEPVRLPADVFGPCARVETLDGRQRVVPTVAGREAACAAGLAGG